MIQGNSDCKIPKNLQTNYERDEKFINLVPLSGKRFENYEKDEMKNLSLIPLS